MVGDLRGMEEGGGSNTLDIYACHGMSNKICYISLLPVRVICGVYPTPFG